MYYQLFADNPDIQSKVAFYPGERSIGRIRSDSVAPPHNLTSLKRRISRVEETPALANADFYAGDDLLKEGYISILGTDGPGLDMDNPMAIVQKPIVQVENPIPDGRYAIKNRAEDSFWDSLKKNPFEVVYFYFGSVEAKNDTGMQVRSIVLQLSSVQRITLFFEVGHYA